jgi:cysteine desulfurase
VNRAPVYLDACATSPPAQAVLEAMAAVQREAWGNPSSLHGYGLAAAEVLERCRLELAALLGCQGEELVFTSGGSESIHLALLGAAQGLQPGRLLISAVEHPASLAAAQQLAQRGWHVQPLPVNREGLLDPAVIAPWLDPPTRLVSLIWGQSEVGSLQPIEAIGRLCRSAGVPLHVDAVQVVGHRPVCFDQLPVDLLSLTAHKLQGPRGIGALLVRQGLPLAGQIGGGGQERGRRAGTEPVALMVGMLHALQLAEQRLVAHSGSDPLLPLRDQMLDTLLQRPGLELTGPDPRRGGPRLPHHLSLLVRDPASGVPLSGRRLVQALWGEGYAASSGSACSSGQGADPHGLTPSPVLQALGYGAPEASSGLRLSLGPWLQAADLEALPAALERARQVVAAGR